MSSKRKASEISGQVHPSRQEIVPGAKPPKKKPRKLGPQAPRPPPSETSINAIKKRIRDVRRRLERLEDLPADIRVQDERDLAEMEQNLASLQEQKQRNKMIGKYHMVRFFERQKATRMLKKLRKRVLEAETTEAADELKKQMEEVDVDLNYAMYHPLNMVYISLYPKGKDDGDGEGNDKDGKKREKPPMWFEAKKCMEDGTLEQLREGKLHPAGDAKEGVKKAPPPPKAVTSGKKSDPKKDSKSDKRSVASKPVKAPVVEKKKQDFGETQLNRRMRRALAREKEPSPEPIPDDDSEGGFFEEE
jgi:uncharacterized FlaG/YvyC family protein